MVELLKYTAYRNSLVEGAVEFQVFFHVGQAEENKV